jgi:glutaredoxin
MMQQARRKIHRDFDLPSSQPPLRRALEGGIQDPLRQRKDQSAVFRVVDELIRRHLPMPFPLPSGQHLALYQFHACPFCVKTRRTLHKLNVPVALRDAKNDAQARSELEQLGGKIKVPCLRIEENGQSTWLYESKAIIAYLDERFAGA